jgi:hypothetical protein
MLRWIYFFLMLATGMGMVTWDGYRSRADGSDFARELAAVVGSISAMIIAVFLSWHALWEHAYDWFEHAIPEVGGALHDITVMILTAIPVCMFVLGMPLFALWLLYLFMHRMESHATLAPAANVLPFKKK